MSDSSVSPTDLAKRLIRAATACGARGWCEGTGGNFSAVVRRDPLQLLISRSGTTKYRLSLDDLILINADGHPIEPETGRPSDESTLHATIAATTGAGSVLHTHSVPGTLLGEHFVAAGGFRIRGYEMLKGISGVASHEDEVFVPVIENSQDMDTLGESFQEVHGSNSGLWGFLVAGHGLYVWGKDVEQAQRHAEIFEFLFDCVLRRTELRPFEG